jgi:hypothetical protein
MKGNAEALQEFKVKGELLAQLYLDIKIFITEIY